MFVGRERELSLLNELWNRPHAAFVVCKGRRRIGKSTLIQQFGKSAETFMEFQGAAPDTGISNQEQMNIFVDQLCAQTDIPGFQPDNWQQIFSFLVMAVIPDRKTVILLDEISWMAGKSKSFSAQLKIVWDTKFKKFENLVLVICGSVSSWIDENILNNTGFMGRVSLELTPEELPLHHCNEFWQEKSERISSVEKLKLLSITGGVPRYLEEINPTLTAEENISRLCFEKGGTLFNEFDRIFNDVFERRAGTYKKIVKSLVSGSKTLSAISVETARIKSGHITRCLNDMIESGFIAKDKVYSVQTAKETRRTRYRLKDNYIRFYLKYIEPLSDRIKNSIYDDAAIEDLINWDTIMGLQFENLVLNNRQSIIRLLKINPNSVLSASPYYQKRTAKQEACQVDLIIKTKYSVYVCEVKFRRKIGKGVIDEVYEKISRIKFKELLSIRPVLIYEGMLSENLLREDFFDRIIRFSDLLEK
jgi:AAA+ ATPase superfamily predicted ATPase